jgi:transcriptional antiterminator NusG
MCLALKEKSMSDNAKWYVIHTYSGYENAVKTSIEKFVTGRNMQDLILDMQIPMETVTEVTDSGVTKEVERKVFPGYLLIKMVMTDESWYIVRNCRGVTGFVGPGSKPVPLTEEEVISMGLERQEIKLDFNTGDSIRVKYGPLEGFVGVITDIEMDKKKIKAKVSMFGRDTDVELEFNQVEALV